MNHPPVANKVVLIDFDGTIAPWGPLLDVKPPKPEVATAISELYREGYRVVIFTSRASKRWWKAEAMERGYWNADQFGASQIALVGDYLQDHGIPYHEITAEKLAAEVYFDDKAVRATADDLDERIYQWLEERPAP